MKQALHDPWLHYRDTGLYVVPSIHYRQIFAQLVYEACRRKRFDVIAVELPPSYQHLGVVEEFLSMAPAPGLVINPCGKTELMEVPVNDHPDCKETEVRKVTRGLMYPLTACDSIVMALRCPELLANHWPGWQPEIALIDDERRAAARNESKLRPLDDYEVTLMGLSAFYDRTEALWQPARMVPVDERRERVMGSHLRRYLNEGKEVLFVCGLAHWKSLREYLDTGVTETFAPSSPAKRARLIFAPLEPAVAWLWGWLDDIPRVAWELELSCHQVAPENFDKRATVMTVLKESVAEAQVAQLPVSVRRLLKMESYSAPLAGVAGRWIPELDEHLVHSAAACVEDRFAEIFKQVALTYPAPLPEGVQPAKVMPWKENQYLISAKGETFLLEFPKSQGHSATRRIAIPTPMPLTETEQREYDPNPDFREWPAEETMRFLMSQRARQLARRQQREVFSRKFVGSLCDGPDWRRTVRSFAGFERSLYVRQSRRKKSGRPSNPKLATPVVWIFDDQTPISSHSAMEQLFDKDSDTWCKSALLYLISIHRPAEGRISAYRVAALTDLCLTRTKRRSSSGELQLDPEEDEAADMDYLHEIPEDKRCFLSPWKDDTLQRFSGVEQALAVAIKYADDQVIVVNRSSAPLPARIVEYARSRRVTLCRISIDNFEPKRLDRFAWFHTVPSPLGPYNPPYPWCARFIPPV
jgi:hypothetical protein